MKRPGEYFRAGVGMLVVNADGAVLALERADTDAPQWQLPQGGLDPEELPMEAALRELQEETGIPAGAVELIDVSDWIAYELPENLRSPRTGRGQVLRWHLFRFLGEDGLITPDGQEFRNWRWMPMQALIGEVAEFRRAGYLRLAQQFADTLAG